MNSEMKPLVNSRAVKAFALQVAREAGETQVTQVAASLVNEADRIVRRFIERHVRQSSYHRQRKTIKFKEGMGIREMKGGDKRRRKRSEDLSPK